MSDEERIFEEHEVRPTANRILILRQMLSAGTPLSMMEMEAALGTVDKSIISRTIATFREAGMLHTIEDGGDSVRYELCRSHHAHGHGDDGCDGADDDTHVHFHCEVCGRTWCFEQTPIPQVAYPEGFDVHFINYMAKGICPDCRQKEKH